VQPPASQPLQLPVGKSVAFSSDASSGLPKAQAALRGGGLPVLLGQRHPRSAKEAEESKPRFHAPEAVRAHEAFLSRQLRIAGRRPAKDGLEEVAASVEISEEEAELARATREAFLARQACVASRRLLARA